MNILDTLQLKSNNKIKLNFDGGDLSSDAGLLLIKEFAEKLGLTALIKKAFKTNDHAKFRIHTDTENLLQLIYQIVTGYFEDNCADELTNDPVFKALLDKDSLASQPTLSRFHNRMDLDTLARLRFIQDELRKFVYSVEMPEHVILDIDSTLLGTYGKQLGSKYNHHYQQVGYHPLVCYDGITGDLLRIELRDGSTYCSNGAAAFMSAILNEFREKYCSVNLFLRGDSGFATPTLYNLCEEMDTKFVIRLKDNSVLHAKAEQLNSKLQTLVSASPEVQHVVYGEFEYKAKTWEKTRRVVCKVEKHPDNLFPKYTFIVTNMESEPRNIVNFYCKRGLMENFIKEGKSGFDFGAVSNRSKLKNANNLEIHALAYNIFNYFRRLVLPASMRKLRIDAIRLKLVKVAAKVVSSARYLVFKLCSSCPYKGVFYETLHNIAGLKIQLE